MTKKILMQLRFGGGGGGASASLTEKQKKQNRLRRVMSTPDASVMGRPLACEQPCSSDTAKEGPSASGKKNRRRRHTVQSGADLPTLAPPNALPSIMKVATLDESLHSKYSSSSAGGGTRSTRTSTTASDDTLTSNVSVEFQHVEIREYKRAMGDNPSVQAGPPIGIGWEIEERMVVPIDDYETYKRAVGKHESDQLSFILPRAERERLLMENGYTRKDIADAVREVVRSKARRRTTVVNLGRTTVVEEAVQSLMRKFKRNVLGKDRDIEYSEHHERWAAEAERAARIILEENLAAAAEEACIDIDDIDPSEFVDDADDDIRTNLKSGRTRAAAEALVVAQDEEGGEGGGGDHRPATGADDNVLRSSLTSTITAVEEDEVALTEQAVPSQMASAATQQQPTNSNKPPPIKIFVADNVDGGKKDGATPGVPPPGPSVQDEKVHGEDFAPPKVAPEEGVHGEDFAKKPPMTPLTAKLFGKDLPAAKDLVKIPVPAPATKLFQEMGRAA